MYGPNTNTSGGSIIVYLEAQAAYIRQALQMARDADADAIEVREEAEQALDAEIQGRFAGTAWLDDGKPHLAKGPTGVPVRTFVNLAMNWK